MSDDRVSITTDPGEADFIVCMRYTPPQQMILPDNILDVCAHCRHAIQYRPDVPAEPTRICVPCAIDMTRKHRSDH